MRAIASVLLLAFSACFHPDTSQVTFTCSAGSSPACPDGQECRSGICVDPTVDLASASGDLHTPPPDLAQRSGCARGNGYPVGDAFACPGSFKAGDAYSLCAAGFTPCLAAPQPDTVACGKLEGFFLSNVIGRSMTPRDLTAVKCSGNDYYRVIYGCGNPIKASTAATPCGSFYQLIDCQNVTDFNCPAGPFTDIRFVANPYPLDGVLCCRA